MGLFWFMGLQRRATRLVFALMALAVALPTINYFWPNAVDDVVTQITEPPSTTLTVPSPSP